MVSIHKKSEIIGTHKGIDADTLLQVYAIGLYLKE